MRRGGEDVQIVSTGCRPPSVPRPGRCREDVEIVSTGCRPPSVPRPPHTQEIVPVFSGGPFVLSRGGGADRLASGLQFCSSNEVFSSQQSSVVVDH